MMLRPLCSILKLNSPPVPALALVFRMNLAKARTLLVVQVTPEEDSSVHIAWGFALCQIEEPTLTVEPSIWPSTQPPIFGDVHFLWLALRDLILFPGSWLLCSPAHHQALRLR